MVRLRLAWCDPGAMPETAGTRRPAGKRQRPQPPTGPHCGPGDGQWAPGSGFNIPGHRAHPTPSSGRCSHPILPGSADLILAGCTRLRQRAQGQPQARHRAHGERGGSSRTIGTAWCMPGSSMTPSCGPDGPGGSPFHPGPRQERSAPPSLATRCRRRGSADGCGGPCRRGDSSSAAAGGPGWRWMRPPHARGRRSPAPPCHLHGGPGPLSAEGDDPGSGALRADHALTR